MKEKQGQLPYWFRFERGTLFAVVSGEIDLELADEWRTAIDFELAKRRAKRLVFDFADVTFIDSSGLGVIIGRYRHLSSMGGSVSIINARPTVYRILMVSGFDKIINVDPPQAAAKGGKRRA